MLALFQLSEADDLGMALGRLFLSGNPARKRFASGRCFARYVAIEDPVQRRTALTALHKWMASSAKAVSGVEQTISDNNHVAPDAFVRGLHSGRRRPLPRVSIPFYAAAMRRMTRAVPRA